MVIDIVKTDLIMTSSIVLPHAIGLAVPAGFGGRRALCSEPAWISGRVGFDGIASRNIVQSGGEGRGPPMVCPHWYPEPNKPQWIPVLLGGWKKKHVPI